VIAVPQAKVLQSKYLLIGSTRAGSGKSATVLGLGIHLLARGIEIAYGKPLGTFTSRNLPDSAQSLEADVEFINQVLMLPETHLRPTLLNLDKNTLKNRLLGEDTTDYTALLRQYRQENCGDLVLIEAPANTAEGAVFGLSLQEMSDCLDAPILLVMRFGALLVVDHVLVAKERLGDRLLGVVINDIPLAQIDTGIEILAPYLESQGIPVLAMMPENRILRSVSVAEVIEQLDASVHYRPEHISLNDLMIEELMIGAMDVNSAQTFFRKSHSKAVITGSNRFDIQLAALETSTNCLILTGPPMVKPEILQRAAELDVPVLSVSHDTLTTVKIIEGCLGQVRLHEGIKVNCISDMMAKHFKFDRLLQLLDLKPDRKPV